MIVKNEEPIIARCLDSAADLVDAYCILDTGSTDKTADVIKDKFKDKSGKVHHVKWTSFGEARTQALALAAEQTDVNWWLMLDADMTITYHPDFKQWLSEGTMPHVDFWLVELLESGTIYSLPLLTKAGSDWHYVGATHEYLDPTGHFGHQVLGLTITHHIDSVNRTDKFDRDIKLLQPAFEAGDPRATFYTAKSLHGLGRTEEAIAAYDKRAAMGDFEEEAWYAQYMAGQLMLGINAPDGAKRLIEAYLRRPTRAEPLYHLINWCGRHYPKGIPDDLLFIEGWAYDKQPPVGW